MYDELLNSRDEVAVLLRYLALLKGLATLKFSWSRTQIGGLVLAEDSVD